MSEQPATVLIVDDDRFVRVTLRDTLADESYRILEAADGEEALAILERDCPEVVLLDLFMPKKSGLEVLGEIHQKSPKTRVLVVSSMDAESLIEQALRGGAVGFIAKPFHPLEIVSAIKQALRG